MKHSRLVSALLGESDRYYDEPGAKKVTVKDRFRKLKDAWFNHGERRRSGIPPLRASIKKP